MTDVENNDEPLSEDELFGMAEGVLDELAERFGMGTAVATFLAVLGQQAVQTRTIPQLALSMNACLQTCEELSGTLGPVTLN